MLRHRLQAAVGAAMCPFKSNLAAVAATCCVLSALAQPAEPRPSMTREIETVFEHRSPAKVSRKGHLSEVRERRLIRVLVPNNRTFFFYDGLQSRGLAYEFMTDRETVGYVRNILKYWVAYHLALDPNEDVQPPAAPDKQT